LALSVDALSPGIAREAAAAQDLDHFDVAIIGGLGHVGLPLGLLMAERGLRVCAIDIDERALGLVNAGTMPFAEPGCPEALKRNLANDRFVACADPSYVRNADTIIIVVGTPVDENLNPSFEILRRLVENHVPYLRDGQVVVLRSTVYPGTSARVQHWLDSSGKTLDVVFCPERIVEGRAFEELTRLPQLVSGFSRGGIDRARALFGTIASQTIETSVIEAELAKLFSNAWRYAEFAIANQFFMMANDHNVDFYRVYEAMTRDYPRMQNIPRPGFAAGPCLFKDTMQLAAFNNNQFFLGHSAMLVNEGLPKYLVERIKLKMPLHDKTVGILGMTFKADSDDVRNSLSVKLRKILDFESKQVLCSDFHVEDQEYVSKEWLAEHSDIVILAIPHSDYRSMTFPPETLVIDLWNFWGRGCCI
jgi:UDP-N-acetyl-D-mannosaminuronic acid dehydrogenase